MASSLLLRSNFLDLPGALRRVPNLPFSEIAKNIFAHKYPYRNRCSIVPKVVYKNDEFYIHCKKFPTILA